MAQKNNIRSIRFSDELAELIERQAGRSFTEKFENLITRCVWELPAKEAELKQIQLRIDAERDKLHKIVEYRNSLERNAARIDTQIKQAIYSLDQGLLFLENNLK